MARFLQFDRVSFAYPGMAEPLLADVTAHFPEGTWTGIVGANGESLSHGERKRVQIAIALWHQPDVLALDEPTNHLDAEAKHVLLAALKSFRGAGLLVSHDRDFLDALCSQCLFIFPPRITLRPGGVTRGMEQDRLEQAHARDEHDANAGKARRLMAAAQQRREAAEQSAARTNRLKAKKLPANDHDGRAKRQLAKLTNKDVWGFSQSAALRSRAAKLLAPDSTIRVDYEMGFWLEDAEKSARNYVAELPAGEIDLGDGRVLVHPALSIRPDDRIALVGANGIGKSTLVRKIVEHANVPPERLLVVPQEIGEEESRAAASVRVPGGSSRRQLPAPARSARSCLRAAWKGDRI